MRQILAAASIAVLTATAAQAGEGSKAVGQYVDIAPVALPVVDGGRLRNYVFVNVRLTLNPRVDPNVMRTKEPYFRDALVRSAHRTPFTVPGDWTHINEAALRATLFRQASAIAGQGVITAVIVTSATPQHTTGMAPSRR